MAVGRLLEDDSEGLSDSGFPVLGLIDGGTLASASGRAVAATAGALLIGSVFWVLLGFSVVTPFVGATEMMLGVSDGASDGRVESSVAVGRLLGDSEGLSDTGEPVGMNIINGSLTGAIVVLKASKLGEEVFTASVAEDGIIVGDRLARGSGVNVIGNQSRIGLPFSFLL